jgi:HAMP domain-containing protein
LYLLVYLAWIHFHWGGEENVTLIGDIFNLPIELATTVILLRTATRPELISRQRRAWWFLGLAVASYFVADLCWAYFENVLNEPPFPSIADIFYLSFIPLTLASLLNLADPMRARRRYDRQRYWIDLAITGLAATILISYFVVAGTFAENSGDMIVLLFATAYPVGDVILVTGLLAVWLRRPESDTRSVLGWILPALLCFIGSDLAFAYTSLQGTYISGGWIDAGWNIAFLFLVLAALRQLYQAPRIEDSLRSRRRDQVESLLLIGMVIFALGLVVYLGLVNGFGGAEFSWLTAGALLLLVLVGWRFFGTRGFTDLSLRNKLLSSFLIITLIPLAGLAYYNALATRQLLTDKANTVLSGGAAQTAASLDLFITDSLNNVRTASQSYIWQEFLALPPSERAGSELEYKTNIDLRALARRDQIFIDAVGLMDKNGIDVADTASGEVGSNKSTHQYVAEPLRTGLPYSSVQFSPTTGNLSVYFSAPVRDTNGEIIGVLRVRYKADVLQQIITKSANQLGVAGLEIVLLDENHIRLAVNNEPGLVMKSVVPLSANKFAQLQAERRLPSGLPAEELSTDLPEFEKGLNNAASQPIFSAEVELGEEDITVEKVAVTEMDTQPWLVVAAQPQEVYLAPVKTQTRTAGVIVLAVTVLVTLIALVIARNLSNPIIQLRNIANQIAGGDLQIQVPVVSRDEIGQLAMAFNTMTAQLTRRASELATVAEVGTAASTILDVNTLLQNVVELSKQRFDLYHSHIYLLDETGENLVLVSGAGEPGRQMVAKGHSIPLNREQSLVARAARGRKGVTVNDVTQAPDFLPNSLLPNTRSELAVPLIVGDKVLGVFDVQSDQAGRFSESDVDIQSTLAAQIAIALQNARAFTQAQRQAERETTLNLISQKIQNTTTVEDALQVAARELGRALGAPLTVAQLGVNTKSGTGNPNRRS